MSESVDGPMTLARLLEIYTAANECSPRYVESLRRTVKKAEAIGLEHVCQLEPDAVNTMLAQLPTSAVTRSNVRRELLTLWRFAYERHWTDVYPARIRKIRVAFAPVCAWTPEELRRILAAAVADETPISRRHGILVRDALPAWTLINYDTALRFGDMHRLASHQFVNDCVMLCESKTRKTAVRRLRGETMAAAQALLARSPDGSMFLWFMPRRRAFATWRSFLDRHRFRGSVRWFRRSAATQVHKVRIGAARELLQHSADYLQYRHYLDQSQLEDHPSPPPVFGPP